MTLGHDVKIHFPDGSESNRALSPHEGDVTRSHPRGSDPRVRARGERGRVFHDDEMCSQRKVSPKNDGPSSEPISVEHGAVDQAIFTALADDPFSLVQEISQLTCLPRSTVHRHLIDLLHFRIQHLRWIPDLLSPEEKRIRVNMAGELLPVLSVQGAHQWHDLVMLDESWFYMRSEHDLMWTAPGEIFPIENDVPFNRHNS
jgi:hypothetical protein